MTIEVGQKAASTENAQDETFGNMRCRSFEQAVTEALFTSLVGGDTLRQRVIDVIGEAAALADSRAIDLHVMTFAFTDEKIATALAQAAARHPRLTIRILADWSQRLRARGQQVGRLDMLGLANLRIRYKNDQPYLWDARGGHVRWSYHVSRGLLHHKTLGVLVDGRPWKLVCGSYNWTAKASRSYENLLVMSAEWPACRELMSRIELEFEALWSDGRASLSPAEARAHYRAIVAAYRHDPTIVPRDLGAYVDGVGDHVRSLSDTCYPVAESPHMPEPDIRIAFSSRAPADNASQRGYAQPNRHRHFLMHGTSANGKRVPLTLTTLALDVILRTQPGDILQIAMFGLSARVPEYGALLDAARRGVHVYVLLDGSIGEKMYVRLERVRLLEQLPIEVRSGCKMMHQKYVIHPNSGTVLTGTANMTTDASARHSEHRFVVRGCPQLAAAFSADFRAIWDRLPEKRQERVSSPLLTPNVPPRAAQEKIVTESRPDVNQLRARTLLATPDVRDMQLRLYGARARQVALVSDSDMWKLLSQLRSASKLDAFRLWLVGSRLEPGRHTADIDLVLAPRVGRVISDETIDQALHHCRSFGLYEAAPAGVVDPCFRFDGPCLRPEALSPDAPMRGIKLLSPQRLASLRSGHIQAYRFVGPRSVEYVLQAGRTDYYRKLPRFPGESAARPYLRPALEIFATTS